jgi:uncharacterized protein (TIGR00297 family)
VTPLDVLIGAALAGIVALIAWRFHALTRSGAVAAFVVGTLTYAVGTIGFTLVLLAFFVPSVVLSRIGRARKRTLSDVGKHGPRDAMQVLANGGVATACALGCANAHRLEFAIAFAGAYAAASADTWATEIGTLAKSAPRSIINGRPVAPGMSGGITLAGTLGGIAGAIWVGLVTPLGILLAWAGMGQHLLDALPAIWSALAELGPRVVVIVSLAGIAGATVDSLLGATVQELRRCDVCKRTCETDPHACGNRTVVVRGMRGFSNDVVNFAATLTGAVAAVALALAALP